MRAFTSLLDCLVYTQSRNRKIALLGHYFRTAPDPDRGWALAALTDGVPIRLPLRRMLTDLVSRFIDPTLYRLSRDYVGDTAETVALLWPEDRAVLPPTPNPSPQGGGEQQTSPSPRVRGEGWGEGQTEAPSNVAAPHPRIKSGAGSNPLPVKNGEREKRASADSETVAEREEPNSLLPSTRRGRGKGNDEIEKSKQLVLDLTPTPNPSPQGGGEQRSSPSPRVRGEGRGEGQTEAPSNVAAPHNVSAPHPNPLPVKDGERETGSSPDSGTDGERDGGEFPSFPRGVGEVGHNSGELPALSLGAVIDAMASGTTAERTERLGHLLDQLDASGRWALLKLLGGAPRVGVSARLARTALAESYGRDVSEIEEIWHALAPPYLELFQWLDGKAERPDPGAKPVFRPVMLAHPIEEEDWPRLSPEDFAAEWKWDGIRVQVAARGGEVRMFSRQGDDISGAFPEIRSAFQGHDCVVDGELLIMRDGAIAPFNDLQQRLNRKSVTAKMMTAYPPHVRLYDLLFDGQEDLRALSFGERRQRLEAWHAKHHPRLTDVSPLVDFKSFDELGALWSSARAEGIEGLMLKRRASPYQAGRVKGEWFKWKRAALTLDCVLMYAQRGSGKRSSYYSDYTFGVWRTDENGDRQLVPVGKAYSGFTDEELLLIDKWIRSHTTETFGPVRAVEPELVFEVAFDAVQESTRHKSGVAMRFPRIHRIRWDKPAAEADSLETVLKLAGGGATANAAAPSDLV